MAHSISYCTVFVYTVTGSDFFTTSKASTISTYHIYNYVPCIILNCLPVIVLSGVDFEVNFTATEVALTLNVQKLSFNYLKVNSVYCNQSETTVYSNSVIIKYRWMILV